MPAPEIQKCRGNTLVYCSSLKIGGVETCLPPSTGAGRLSTRQSTSGVEYSMAPGFWELATQLPAHQPSHRAPFAHPRSQGLKFNSGAAGSPCWERTRDSAAHRAWFPPPVPPPDGVRQTRAHSLCRCRSRLAGDPEAPPWGRSRWSGRKSLGRRAPAATSGRHTYRRRSAARGPRTEQGAQGGGAAAAPGGCGAGPARASSCPASPGDRLPPAGRAQGLAPCLLDANRIFLPRFGSAFLWGVVFSPPLR